MFGGPLGLFCPDVESTLLAIDGGGSRDDRRIEELTLITARLLQNFVGLALQATVKINRQDILREVMS